jgi:hypothetical protein
MSARRWDGVDGYGDFWILRAFPADIATPLPVRLGLDSGGGAADHAYSLDQAKALRDALSAAIEHAEGGSDGD